MKCTPQDRVTAGMPAAPLLGIVTEQDREIVRRRASGETRKAISDSLGITISVIQRAEWRCERDRKARELLADCADSIEGLYQIGELIADARDALIRHRYRYEGPALERMSDVAALGRLCVSRLHGIGPKALASIDRVLSLLDIAWSLVDLMPKPKPAQQEPRDDDDGPMMRAVCRDLESLFNRLYRLEMRVAYLEGYMSERFKGREPMRDITPEPDSEDLEVAGNVVCLPGVTLASISLEDDDDPGPRAA